MVEKSASRAAKKMMIELLWRE